MNRLIVLILFTCFVLSPIIAQDKLEFNPTYGVSNYHGESDLKVVSANYQLINKKLVFEIEVFDNEVVFNENKLESDHLEFWFSINEESEKLFKILHDKGGNDWYTFLPHSNIEDESQVIPEFKKAFMDRSYAYRGDPDSSILESKVHWVG
jgi:hypothetical protein